MLIWGLMFLWFKGLIGLEKLVDEMVISLIWILILVLMFYGIEKMCLEIKVNFGLLVFKGYLKWFGFCWVNYYEYYM